MSYAVGSLVKARNREWVVLPESDEKLLLLKPLGGSDDEVTGIYVPLEKVEPATFGLPDPTEIGDYRSCRMLRDAVRIGFRSSAGPFRSFARIAVAPRPYQLVPLLMALKLEPVRLLIADDVGIGKTIEACLIAKELLDRGEVTKLSVLCPPHLAEQWQKELNKKFHINAELVLPSTTTRLERNCRMGESLFEYYPYTIVSSDFIKSDRRRDEFLRTCPKLVIVDEAHTCVYAGERGSSRHQRHKLVSGLAGDESRHLILVTATPHSGKEQAFRSLLKLLKPDFAELPEDLGGKENVHHRRNLATHFVQRRRADIEHYLGADTIFPKREDAEQTYNLSDEYKHLFKRILKYAREIVTDPETNKHRQRVRWWSALALLRSLASSPAAAEATLKQRAVTADTLNAVEADDIGRRTVLDIDDESTEATDLIPGSDSGEDTDEDKRNRHLLLDMAREAEKLKGDKDNKLQEAIKLIKQIVKDGFNPIIFCRFIPTAEYVAEALRKELPKGIEVAAVTGLLPPTERENRVEELGKADQRVLVATDCLSEGINLQEYFDAVMHYDLSWNPTRHEQREGRVDRFGQKKPIVRVLTYYGVDNQIDGIVLDVLLRKHKKIRSSIGISVPVPVETDKVVEAIFEGILLREVKEEQLIFQGLEEYLKPQKEELFKDWDNAANREKRSRTMFAQETLKVEEVSQELKAAETSIGSQDDIRNFTIDAVRAHGGVVSENGSVRFDLTESSQALLDSIGDIKQFKACFDLPVDKDVLYLSRTHPVVEGLATYVMDTALDPQSESIAKRCGVIRTSLVEKRTTALLTRFRYHIISQLKEVENTLLAEDCQIVAFTGAPDNAEWLSSEEAEKLLNTKPEANINPDQATQFIKKIIEGFDAIRPHLEQVAKEHGKELLDAHTRVREAASIEGVTYKIEPKLPPDILGVYVYLPKP